MVRFVFFLVLMGLHSLVNADILKHATTAVIIADWGQTLDIERHPRLYETNPILGQHPERGEINTYFIGKLLLHFYINSLDYKEIRRAWNITQFAVTVKAVNNNISAGLEIRF